MAYHPLNLAIRFILELVALYSAGEWAWKSFSSTTSWFLASIWGIFNVPEDKSRSGKTVVKVPGFIRLLLEFFIFGLAGWFLHKAGHPNFSKFFLIIVVVHYSVSFGRIKWLLKK